jgi:hypothetical protein
MLTPTLDRIDNDNMQLRAASVKTSNAEPRTAALATLCRLRCEGYNSDEDQPLQNQLAGRGSAMHFLLLCYHCSVVDCEKGPCFGPFEASTKSPTCTHWKHEWRGQRGCPLCLGQAARWEIEELRLTGRLHAKKLRFVRKTCTQHPSSSTRFTAAERDAMLLEGLQTWKRCRGRLAVAPRWASGVLRPRIDSARSARWCTLAPRWPTVAPRWPSGVLRPMNASCIVGHTQG